MIRFFARLVVTSCVVAFAFLGVGPHVLGYRTLTVLTGSMSPGMPSGSIAVIARAPAAAVTPGQVLTFRAPVDANEIVTHRVISVEHDDNGIIIDTKGDANAAPDPWHARITDPTVWRLRFVVPVVGSLVRLFRSPALHYATLYGLTAVLAMIWLRGIWRPVARHGVRA